MEIIPAIDIIGGKCVRLTQGDYNKCKTYYENPLEVAKIFQDNGIKRLHLIDLDGAKSNEPKNLKTLDLISSKTKLKIEFGGGIKSLESLNNVLNNGATWGIVGSVAVNNKDLFKQMLDIYSPDKIILGLDIRENRIAINGWEEFADDKFEDLIDLYLGDGLKNIIITDIEKDGMLCGASIELYKQIINKYPQLNIIASGGIKSAEDITELRNITIKSGIVGKAIYEGNITLDEIKLLNN